MLFEFHILQNHAPSNLNRDDTGSPKDCTFGCVRRARISSQCLKRSIRMSDCFRRALEHASLPLASRTRKLPMLVANQVEANLLARGVKKELAESIKEECKLKASGFGTKEGKENAEQRTAQTMFLTDWDVQAVAQLLTHEAMELVSKDPSKAAAAFKKLKVRDWQESKALKERRPITVDIALFGRMVTSPAFEDVEASMQVAHALSTHRIEMEFDYYTAVDDLAGSQDPDELGADMIGDVEFNSACFYKYFSLDLKGLIANLVGPSSEHEAAGRIAEIVVPAFLQAAALSTPSGKQNTFAAHNLPSAILVEVRPYALPVSYANAFLEPVKGRKNLMEESVKALVEHVTKTHTVFGLPAKDRLWLSIDGLDGPEGVRKHSTLSELLDRVRNLVVEETRSA